MRPSITQFFDFMKYAMASWVAFGAVSLSAGQSCLEPLLFRCSQVIFFRQGLRLLSWISVTEISYRRYWRLNHQNGVPRPTIKIIMGTFKPTPVPIHPSNPYSRTWMTSLKGWTWTTSLNGLAWMTPLKNWTWIALIFINEDRCTSPIQEKVNCEDCDETMFHSTRAPFFIITHVIIKKLRERCKQEPAYISS